MTILARAKDRDQLAEMTDVIHDRWIDLDTFRFDKGSRRVTFDLIEEEEYYRARKGGRFVIDAKQKLIIENAISMNIEDTERIGRYDLNRIEFDEDAGILRLLTNVPLVAEIRVSSIDVFVERLVD